MNGSASLNLKLGLKQDNVEFQIIDQQNERRFLRKLGSDSALTT